MDSGHCNLVLHSKLVEHGGECLCACADADEEDFGEYVAHRTSYRCIDSNINILLSSFTGLLFLN